MKKLVMEKETEEAVIDQIGSIGRICWYRKKEVAAGLQRNKRQCKRRNSVQVHAKRWRGGRNTARRVLGEGRKSRKGGLDVLHEIPLVGDKT